MIIYHGSSEIIKNPQYRGGDDCNDYGNGFYTTNEPDIAREWAVKPHQDGYLNIYELDTNGLKFADLNQSCYTALNWMALLYKNRNINGIERHKQRIKAFVEKFLPDTSDADVIVGYRADDRYFRFGKLFIRNDLSLKDLEDSLLLGNLGQQIFLQSEEVFRPERLQFLGSEHIPSSEWYTFKENREKKANSDFEKIENRSRMKNEITIEDILENDGWKYARPANILCKNRIQIPSDAISIKANFRCQQQYSTFDTEPKNLFERLMRERVKMMNNETVANNSKNIVYDEKMYLFQKNDISEDERDDTYNPTY